MSITRAVIVPRELGGDRHARRPGSSPVIAAGELREPLRVGVERRRRSRRRPWPRSAARPVRSALGERSPERVQAGVGHLQHAADVGRLGPVEEELGRRRVGVAAVLALEHARARPGRRGSRGRCAGAGPGARAAPRHRSGPSAASSVKRPELDGAQQRLRAPEPEAQLHDRVGRDLALTANLMGFSHSRPLGSGGTMWRRAGILTRQRMLWLRRNTSSGS